MKEASDDSALALKYKLSQFLQDQEALYSDSVRAMGTLLVEIFLFQKAPLRAFIAEMDDLKAFGIKEYIDMANKR